MVSNFGMDKQPVKLRAPRFPNDQHVDREFKGKRLTGNLVLVSCESPCIRSLRRCQTRPHSTGTAEAARGT